MYQAEESQRNSYTLQAEREAAQNEPTLKLSVDGDFSADLRRRVSASPEELSQLESRAENHRIGLSTQDPFRPEPEQSPLQQRNNSESLASMTFDLIGRHLRLAA